jgi:hypothetical protein
MYFYWVIKKRTKQPKWFEQGYTRHASTAACVKKEHELQRWRSRQLPYGASQLHRPCHPPRARLSAGWPAGRPAHHVMGNETFRVGRRYGNWKIDRDGSNGSCSVSSTTAIDGSVSVAVCTWNVPVRMSSWAEHHRPRAVSPWPDLCAAAHCSGPALHCTSPIETVYLTKARVHYDGHCVRSTRSFWSGQGL